MNYFLFLYGLLSKVIMILSRIREKKKQIKNDINNNTNIIKHNNKIIEKCLQPKFDFISKEITAPTVEFYI